MYGTAKKRQRSYWLQRLGEPPRRLDLRMDLQAAARLRPSPDATKMAAHIRTAAGFQVIVEDLTTHAIRKLTPSDRNIGFPCSSPDGKWMALEETAKGSSSVLYLPANGGEISRLAASPTQTFVSDWSPDSEKILFAGLHDGVWDIFWIARATAHLEQLTHFKSESGFVRYPSWSPKNDQVLFERTDLTANIYVGELQ
jgi:Tol biopolymer transport system component